MKRLSRAIASLVVALFALGFVGVGAASAAPAAAAAGTVSPNACVKMKTKGNVAKWKYLGGRMQRDGSIMGEFWSCTLWKVGSTWYVDRANSIWWVKYNDVSLK